jgi:hypothetical protein
VEIFAHKNRDANEKRYIFSALNPSRDLSVDASSVTWVFAFMLAMIWKTFQ